MFNEKIQEELTSFFLMTNQPKNIKLIIDFEDADMSYEPKKMNISDIKYKKTLLLKKKEVNIKKKDSKKTNLF